MDAVVKTTKISETLQATRGVPLHGAGTVWSQFARVLRENILRGQGLSVNRAGMTGSQIYFRKVIMIYSVNKFITLSVVEHPLAMPGLLIRR